MSNDIKLSIGIPTYNQGSFLEKTILSILNQTVRPYEIVVSNNHSTDGETDEVLKKFEGKIKVIKPPSFLSMMENWNFLCRNLKGTHVSLISSDDFYEPNFVQSFLEICKPDGVLYRFGFNLINDQNEILEVRKIRTVRKVEKFPNNFYEQIRGPKASFAAFVVSRKSLEEVEFFDENLKLIGDWGLWIKLSPKGKFYYSDNVVSNYRTEYRPSLTKDRFLLNVKDFVYMYTVVQKNIINEHHLKPFVNKNAIQIHLYKFEQDRLKNGLQKPEVLKELEKMVGYKLINSRFEFKSRMLFQTLREFLFKT